MLAYLQNPNGEPASVDIMVHDSTGDLIGQAALVLPAGGRLSRLLSELIEGLPPVIGGYVRIRSTLPVQAIELFGDFQGTFLSTVGGSPVSP